MSRRLDLEKRKREKKKEAFVSSFPKITHNNLLTKKLYICSNKFKLILLILEIERIDK